MRISTPNCQKKFNTRTGLQSRIPEGEIAFVWISGDSGIAQHELPGMQALR